MSSFIADLPALLDTIASCWGLLLVAGVGIAALPWTDAELRASGAAMQEAALAPLRLLWRRRAPVLAPTLCEEVVVPLVARAEAA